MVSLSIGELGSLELVNHLDAATEVLLDAATEVFLSIILVNLFARSNFGSL